jgi:pyrroline-5-carboxylate reductase
MSISTRRREQAIPLPPTIKVGFLGAGNMAEAVIRGLIRANALPVENILASDNREDRLSQLASELSIRIFDDNAALVDEADIIVLAVKPQILPDVLVETSHRVTEHKLLISMAAGVTIDEIAERVKFNTRIVRTMPNICALVGEAATALSAGAHVREGDVGYAKTIFGVAGLVIDIDESLMDAVTGLSGSGPAYLFLIIDALADAGVKVGLTRDDALKLAAQTVKGSADMLLKTREHPGRLKDMVTSPGGTAIAGVATLEAGGLRTTLINAVEAATRRAKELGQRDR